MGNVERQLVGIGKDARAIAEKLVHTVAETVEAMANLISAVDWEALAEAMGETEAEPDENPVRPIGIKKGRWKRFRSKTRRF